MVCYGFHAPRKPLVHTADPPFLLDPFVHPIQRLLHLYRMGSSCLVIVSSIAEGSRTLGECMYGVHAPRLVLIVLPHHMQTRAIYHLPSLKQDYKELISDFEANPTNIKSAAGSYFHQSVPTLLRSPTPFLSSLTPWCSSPTPQFSTPLHTSPMSTLRAQLERFVGSYR